MTLATDGLKDQRIDYDTVHTVEGALGDVANGLDGLSDTLDPKGIGQLGEGMKATADFLEDKLAPAADHAADQLDQSTEGLRTDAQQLSKLLRDAPLDLKAVRAIHDSLGRFDDGLDRLNTRLDPARLAALKDGFKGMEDALNTGADDVDRLSGYSYPSVRLSGLKPTVDEQPFWPDGKKIADGMRRARAGRRRPAARSIRSGKTCPSSRFNQREPKGRRNDARRPGQRPGAAGQGRGASQGRAGPCGPAGGRTAAVGFGPVESAAGDETPQGSGRLFARGPKGRGDGRGPLAAAA